MHKLYELKDKLCEELEEFGGKEMNVGDLEVIDKLAHAIKNLDKIIEAYEEEDGEMSHDGDGMTDGRSYRRGGRSSRSYARGRGAGARRDAMGRYSNRGRSNRYDGGMSYGDGTEELIDAVRDMMNDLPENAKREAQRFVQKLESETM